MKATDRRTCPVCNTLLDSDSESCPVCALQGALTPEDNTSAIDSESGLRFEHYQILKNADGTPIELGHGAMGVTYKAIDVHLQCAVALKIINAQLIGDTSARHRFVREARAAASVHHQNVASVFHLGEIGGNYFYVMEFVDGETLERLIRHSGKLEVNLALEVVSQVAAGLTAIQKHHLVHRDVKPSNIMVTLEEDRLESVKIIDLGLAKGVAEQETISAVGSFTGTPGYASPEQFAGLGADIRSDLYSLGITLWEMLVGKPPFQGSGMELMDQHQHAALPTEKLRSVPAPVIALLQVLLAKDPNQRFQDPAQLQRALARVKEALASGSRPSASELRTIGEQRTAQSPRRTRNTRMARWLITSAVCAAVLLSAYLLFVANHGSFFSQPRPGLAPSEKSIAVLPFESLSENKNDSYFADGVQDEILSNVARISQLKVISRTSVMQYRPDARRDLRQIANALGVAHVLEGTVRRASNRVRITVELVDAGSDHAIWSEIYDRDLRDIFAIQSEVAETIARKLTATLSPEEKKRIQAKPTENLQAYDLYLRAKELMLRFGVLISTEPLEKPLADAISLLEKAVRLDPNFTLAYCELARANGLLYVLDPAPERRPAGEAAIKSALRLQPDLPEVHLAYAYHLSFGYDEQDYERARGELAIAKTGLSNNAEVLRIEAYIDRRKGNWERAIKGFKESIALDPRNTATIRELTDTFLLCGQFKAAEEGYDRLIELLPDQPMLKVEKSGVFAARGDDGPFRSAIAALPASMAEDKFVLTMRLWFALDDRNWAQAKEIVEKFKGGEDHASFAFGRRPVPAGCYSIFIARLEGENAGANPSFAQIRQQLNQKVQKSPESANFLSQLAVVDALLGDKEKAIAEARRAVKMLPISKDAVEGPFIVTNLAIVYAWTDEVDLAFETLIPLVKTPFGPVLYSPLKTDPTFDPLRKDPRFEKLLAESAPKD